MNFPGPWDTVRECLAWLQRAASGTTHDIRGAPSRRTAAAHRLRPPVRGGACATAGLPHLQPCQEDHRRRCIRTCVLQGQNNKQFQALCLFVYFSSLCFVFVIGECILY